MFVLFANQTSTTGEILASKNRNGAGARGQVKLYLIGTIELELRESSMLREV